MRSRKILQKLKNILVVVFLIPVYRNYVAVKCGGSRYKKHINF